METTYTSHEEGIVNEIFVSDGDQVAANQLLLQIKQTLQESNLNE
jgi:multidrug efflux pump subunit AcrA (membrane-fusion protein)